MQYILDDLFLGVLRIARVSEERISSVVVVDTIDLHVLEDWHETLSINLVTLYSGDGVAISRTPCAFVASCMC